MAPSLTNVEAQRIMAILEETYLKLQLLSHVPPLQRVPDYEAFTAEVGPEVAQVLDEQVLLEQQLEEIHFLMVLHLLSILIIKEQWLDQLIKRVCYNKNL